MPAEAVKNKREFVNDVTTEDGAGENSDSQLLFGDKNPLLNPVILTRLFEICELSQLLNLRLVSKQWYSLSLTPFREEMLVTIHPQKWMRTPMHLRKSGKEIDNLLQWHTLGEHLDELDFGEKPFKSYRIYEMNFSLQSPPPIPLNLRMGGNMDGGHPGESWGRYIRKLELRNPFVSSRKAFRKAIFEGMPNLEKLGLHDVKINKSCRDEVVEAAEHGEPHLNLKHVMVDRLRDLPCPWKLFLQHFPKIQKLEIESDVTVTASSPEYDVATQLLETIVKHQHPLEIIIANLTLQILSEDSIPKITHFLEITSLKIQILRISLSILQDEDYGLLSTVFLHHGQTLQALTVVTSPISVAMFQPCEDFPCQPGPFHNLTKLALEPHVIGNLHFLAKFPNLVTLRLFQMEHDRILEGTDFTRLKGVGLLNLRKFEFLVVSLQSEQTFGISEEAMNALVKLMPNLEMFKGQLSNSSLRVLFQNWRNLRKLYVTACWDGAIDDAGITGITHGGEEQLPNITDLQILQDLSLAGVEVKRDATVWDGFLKMPCLQQLYVKLQPEICDDAFKALREKFPCGGVERRLH